jgi:hypothetical protein
VFFFTGPAATIGLEVKYPTENLKVIRTIVKPTGKPVDGPEGLYPMHQNTSVLRGIDLCFRQRTVAQIPLEWCAAKCAFFPH